MRKCKYCGKEFKAFNPKQDYCSRECYEQDKPGGKNMRECKDWAEHCYECYERIVSGGKNMREIKFRGKRVDNGDWVYGCYLETQMSGAYIIGSTMEAKGKKESIKMHDKLWQHEVIPETVGQYTGLKDKNEKEIYEGDVLRNIDNPLVDKLPFKVVWNEYYGAWFWLALEGEDGTDHFYQSIASDCEVVGNIHDKEG